MCDFIYSFLILFCFLKDISDDMKGDFNKYDFKTVSM